MGQVSYSSPKSFEDMAEDEVVVVAPVAEAEDEVVVVAPVAEVVDVAAEAVAEVNDIEVAE